MTGQKVRDIMTTNVRTCIQEDNIYECAVKMKSWDVGAIPVTSDGHMVGIITDRDLVLRAMAEKKPNSTQVTEIMTADVITAAPDMSVEEVTKLMSENQIRRVPVVEEDKLVGMCAIRDIAIRDELNQQTESAITEISEERNRSHPTAH